MALINGRLAARGGGDRQEPLYVSNIIVDTNNRANSPPITLSILNRRVTTLPSKFAQGFALHVNIDGRSARRQSMRWVAARYT